jgi:hypothetical protein
MTSLLDYKAGSPRRGICQRCHVDFEGGPRGNVQLQLLYRKSGSGGAPKNIAHATSTLCQSCSILVFEQLQKWMREIIEDEDGS